MANLKVTYTYEGAAQVETYQDAEFYYSVDFLYVHRGTEQLARIPRGSVTTVEQLAPPKAQPAQTEVDAAPIEAHVLPAAKPRKPKRTK